MRHVLTVKVVERLQRLLCVHSCVLLANTPILLAHLRDTLVNILQVDAQHVVLYNLRVIVLDDVAMLELLVPLDLFLDRLDFLLIKTQVRVHQLDHLDGKRLSIVYVKCLVDLTRRPTPQLLAHLPLNVLPIDPVRRSCRCFGWFGCHLWCLV